MPQFKQIFLFLILLSGPAACLSQEEEWIKITEDLELLYLKDSIYLHRSWHVVAPYGRIPSNGLLVIRQGEALLIDTPMNQEKTEHLYNFVRDSLHTRITHFMPGHFHDDCMAGIAYLHEQGVVSRGSMLTNELAVAQGKPGLQEVFRIETSLNFNGTEVTGWYPGPGHTRDNIVIFIKDSNILYGGCLVKSLESKGLGNTADADMERWASTLKGVLSRFPDTQIVIPGHGNPGGLELLRHSIALTE